MRKRTWLMLSLFLIPWVSQAQMTIGQYEEEAPLRTWNIAGFIPASGIGRAEIMTLIADSPAVAFNNPSLIAGLPRLSFYLNGSISRASLFRFGPVNTGVLKSSQNLWIRTMALDGAGLALKAGKWALSFGVAITEYYDRPSVLAESVSGGKTNYKINFSQEGFLRAYNLALARKLGRKLAIGLALNLSQGNLERKTEESWPLNQISILDKKDGSLKDQSVRFGFMAEISKSLKIAFALEPAHRLEKESHSLLEYSASTTGTKITIEDRASDFIQKPLQLSLAGSYLLGQQWLICAEVTFFNWSKYKLTWFSEQETRNFRDVLRLALALENLTSFRLFHQSFSLTTRLGLLVDPQPMKVPRSTYYSLGSGFSLGWKWFRLDFGASWGQEKGSGSSLESFRSALALNTFF
jgi:hypothetical protein